ncbi:hypothetical protein COB55_04090 [Candidatus Wolfebacteria bacterium]|nr:MAG: hypothetical protein COB55_04090 [Candidatus Wolfebacteria bacterium]
MKDKLQESIDRILFISNWDLKNPPKMNEGYGYIGEMSYDEVEQIDKNGYPSSHEYVDGYRVDEAVPPRKGDKDKLPSQGGPMPQSDVPEPEGEIPDISGEEGIPDLGGEPGGLPDIGDEEAPEMDVQPTTDDSITGGAPEPTPDPEPAQEPEVSKSDIQSVEKEVESVEDYSKKVLTQQASMMATIQDMASKIGNVDQLSQQVQKIGQDIESMKPPTYEEQLDMVSTKSYPYNVSLGDYWNLDDQESEQQPQEDLTVSQDEIKNYDSDLIKSSLFDTGDDEEQEEMNINGRKMGY